MRLAVLALLAGCTVEPGSGFADLQALTVSAAFVPGVARDLGEGAFLTDESYTVDLDAFALSLGQVALLELQGGGGGGGTFDPASPPAGYTLCHGGHCHAESGELVSYADVEAELAGGAAAFEPVVAGAVDAEADLLAGFEATLDGAPHLPQARITKIAVEVTRLRMDGTVTHPDLAEPIALRVDLPLALDLQAGVEILVDRDHPPVFTVDVATVVDGTLLDGLDLAALASDGAIVIDDLEDAGADALLFNLFTNELAVTITAVEGG